MTVMLQSAPGWLFKLSSCRLQISRPASRPSRYQTPPFDLSKNRQKYSSYHFRCPLIIRQLSILIGQLATALAPLELSAIDRCSSAVKPSLAQIVILRKALKPATPRCISTVRMHPNSLETLSPADFLYGCSIISCDTPSTQHAARKCSERIYALRKLSAQTQTL